MKPDLQQRILGVLSEHGSVAAKDMPHWLKDVDYIALDCGLGALKRANKITVTRTGHYELVQKPRNEHGQFAGAPIAEALAEPPISTGVITAAKYMVCKTCTHPKPICEFRLNGSGGNRADECNKCHGVKTQLGQIKYATAARAQPRADMSKAPPQIVQEAPAAPEPPKLPVVVDLVFERVRAKGRELNEKIGARAAQIMALQVGNTADEREIARLEEFLETYSLFAEGAK